MKNSVPNAVKTILVPGKINTFFQVFVFKSNTSLLLKISYSWVVLAQNLLEGHACTASHSLYPVHFMFAGKLS
jgi:hypothetical protein